MNKIRYMKKLIICLILLITSVGLYSQERVNGRQYNYSTSSLSVENNIVGWIFNESSGQWVSHRNFITQYKDSWISNNGQYKNIKSLSLKTVDLGGKTLYIMYIMYMDGSYKYKNIHEDWQTHTAELLYILNERDIDRIKNPTEDVVEIVASGVYNYGHLYTTNELIRKAIDSPLSGLKFYIKRYKDVVRVNYKFADDCDSSLSKYYFEIPYSEWKKLSLQNKL